MSGRNITIKRGICCFLINQNLCRRHIDKGLGLRPSQLPSVTVWTLVGGTETQPHTRITRGLLVSWEEHSLREPRLDVGPSFCSL